jgi:protein SCO1/2
VRRFAGPHARIGKFTLLYFGFTKCPDICPAELVKMGEISTRLAQRGSKAPKLAPIFISIDGNREFLGARRPCTRL